MAGGPGGGWWRGGELQAGEREGGRDPGGNREMQASSSLHGGFNLHPLAKNAENSLSKKLPRRLRDGRERERGRDRENEG